MTFARKLASAWTTSTIGHAAVGRNLERALAYGVAIPLQQWHEFGGHATTVDQIRGTLQTVAARLAVDRHKADYLEQHRDLVRPPDQYGR